MKKRAISFLLAFIMILGIVPISSFTNKAFAEIGDIEEKPYTLRPKETIVEKVKGNWVAGAQKNDKINRASVPLQKRFRGELINPLASREAKIQMLSLMNSKAETRSSVGAEGFKTYAFDNWQYLDSAIFWDGVVPTPDVIDAGHRNGVAVYGTLFFNWTSSGQDQRIFLDFIREDSPNSKTFPEARKIVDVAKYYGFDGYFINQETTGGALGGKGIKMREFMLYAKKYSEEQNYPIRFSWYDAMANDGYRSHYNAVNGNNDYFVKPDDTGTIPAEEFFINFNWGYGRNLGSVEHMKSIGRSGFDAYAGFELQQNSINTPIEFNGLIDPQTKKPFISIGLFTPDSILGLSKDGEDYHVKENNFWTGYEGDPSISGDSRQWRGMSRFIGDSSPIMSLPFKTFFNTGHGKQWFENGKLSRDYKWNARGVSEILPTWRWWILTDGTRLAAKYDFDKAYYGGNSINFSGTLDSTNQINLYSTKVNATANTKVDIVTLGGEGSQVYLGVTTDPNYAKENFKYYPLNISSSEWTRTTVDLSELAGQEIRAFNIKVEGSSDSYSLNIGELSVYDDRTQVPSVNGLKVSEHLLFDAKNSEAIIEFDRVDGADYYVAYVFNGEGYEFLQASSSNIMYLPNIERNEKHSGNTQELRVVTVGKNGTISEPATVNLDWKMTINDTGSGIVKDPLNVVLGAHVTARSAEESGEKAENALNGTITGNSDKWTIAGASRGWMTIKLTQPRTVRRWRVEHAGHGGESVNDGKMNTRDFDLLYKNSNGEWVVAKSIRGNRAHVTDVNLDEPITAQEWKLDILYAHNGTPWGAVRIYNWMMFEEKLDLNATKVVPMSQVTAENQEGNKYNIVFRNVPRNTEIQIFKDRNATTSLGTRSTGAQSGNLTFENVVLEGNNGLVFYTSKSEGKEASEVLAVVYEGKTETPEEVEYIDSSSEYEVYPLPQNVKYLDRAVKLTKNVNVVLEEGIDQYTVAKLDEILNSKQLQKSTGTEVDSTKVNILVGVKGSEKFVDNYFKENITLTDHFGEYDAYQLVVKDNVIAILGKDTDAAFYGLVTLQHIFNQLEDNAIRHLEINDFANQKIRGAIEGYYGIPWGNENRKDLIEFGGKFKNNALIFAPKDDPYHREKWRELYPQEELEGFRKLGEAGLKNKNRFVWTISPFKKTNKPQNSQPITASNVDEGIRALLAKFDQLYSVGIRQFGVLGDDVGGLPYSTVVKVMKAVSEWAKSKPEQVYDTVFVPQNYTLGDWGGRRNELTTYQNGFPADIHIMYTGTSVLAPVTQSSISAYKNRIPGVVMRDPLFWLNWPVNDIDRREYRRVFMGKGSMLEKGVKGLAGVVTNPLEEPHASLPAIFAVSDYTWNTNAFNDQKSWEDSFKYIDPNAALELKEIATHMASANNGGISGLAESEDLKVLMDAFKNAVNSGNASDIIRTGEALKSGYQKIVDAVNGFNTKSTFEKLKKELTPYISGLRDKSEAAVKYIETIMVKYKEEATGNKLEKAKQLYAMGEEKYTSSKTYKVRTSTSEFPNAEFRAESGTKYINSNIQNFLRTKAAGIISDLEQNNPEPKPPVDPKYKEVKYELSVPNIITNPTSYYVDERLTNTKPVYAIDGNEDTFAWYGVNGDKYEPGYYFGLDLKSTKRIGTFKFTMGGIKGSPESDNGKDDYFKQYRIRYSKDKVNWETFENPITQSTPKKTVEAYLYKENIQARYVVVEAMNEERKWVRLSEISVTVLEEEVDKSHLKQLVEGIDQVISNFEQANTEESVNNLKEKLEDGRTVLLDDTATQAEVDKAIDDIQNAVLALKPKTQKVDKEILDKTVKLIEGILSEHSEEFTDTTLNPLKEKLTQAKEALSDTSTNQETVDRLLSELIEAFKGLERKPETPVVNLKQLEYIINFVEEQIPNVSDKVTKESLDNLQKELEIAKALIKKPDVTQEEANDEALKLASAYADLKQKPQINKDALKEALTQAEAKLEEKLDKQSRATLQAVIEESEALLKNEQATQEDINAQTAKVLEAISNAKVIETSDTGSQTDEYIIGYSRVNQYMRDKQGNIQVIIPRNEKVSGFLIGNKVYTQYKDKIGYVYRVNVVDEPVLINGYTTNSLNIRDDAGNKIGELPKGYKVENAIVFGNKVLVSYNGATGYIHSSFIKDKPPVIKGIVVSDQYVRNINGIIVTIIKAGTEVEGEVINNKIKVSVYSREGYIYASKVVKP